MEKVGPRSYKVLNEEGNEVIRNKKHLRGSRNDYNVVIRDEGFFKDCESEMQNNNKGVGSESTDTNIVRNLNNVPMRVATRSSRHIRPPQRFRDFVMY